MIAVLVLVTLVAAPTASAHGRPSRLPQTNYAFFHSELTRGNGVVITQEVTIPLSTPPYLDCNHTYKESDSNASFSITHLCGGSTGAWSLKESAFICSIATTPQNESGMSWDRNGQVMPAQAPHYEWCGYIFHGSFNPDRDGDAIGYGDYYTFGDILGGTATLFVYGQFTTTGTPY